MTIETSTECKVIFDNQESEAKQEAVVINSYTDGVSIDGPNGYVYLSKDMIPEVIKALKFYKKLITE